MKSGRLFSLLKSLDETERKRLHEMIVSPFFNKDNKCIQLFELLLPFAPDFTLTEVDKDFITKQLFPGRGWNDSIFAVRRTKLVDLIYELLIHFELKERKGYANHLLMNVLISKRQDKVVETIYHKSKALIAHQPKKNINSYLDDYLLDESYLSHLTMKKGRTTSYNNRLIALIQAFDSFYLAKKMNLSVEALSLKKITGLEYEDVLLDRIGDITSAPEYQDNPYIQFYTAILPYIKDEEDEAAFQKFLDLLDSPLALKLTSEELNFFYIQAINYCSKRIKAGLVNYKKILFKIYKDLIASGLLITKKYASTNRMKNIISVACQLGETEWARMFLESYKNQIDPSHSESATNMFNAFICFYERDFQGTLLQLTKMQSDIDVLYFLNTRTFQIRCYYELSESNAFYSLCTSFKDYLRRTKKEISTSKKKSHTNFTRLAYQLYRRKEGFSKKSKEDLLTKIESTRPLELKPWLLEKCNELR